jgi:hypothetical protein
MPNTSTYIQSFIDRWTASGAAERAAEEAQGHIRWLPPAYQVLDEVQVQQPALLKVTGTCGVPIT